MTEYILFIMAFIIICASIMGIITYITNSKILGRFFIIVNAFVSFFVGWAIGDMLRILWSTVI